MYFDHKSSWSLQGKGLRTAESALLTLDKAYVNTCRSTSRPA